MIMKRSIFFTVFLLTTVMSGYNNIYAQSPQFSIFDSFETRQKAGEGAVIIHQSEAIKKLVGTRIDSENIDLESGNTYIFTEGYRIQVYSGNIPRTSRDEVSSLQQQIKELYPSIETYPKYSAPFWKLHIGDFRSFEEASFVLRDLRSKFPQKKNEIYIIVDEIRLLLDK